MALRLTSDTLCCFSFVSLNFRIYMISRQSRTFLRNTQNFILQTSNREAWHAWDHPLLDPVNINVKVVGVDGDSDSHMKAMGEAGIVAVGYSGFTSILTDRKDCISPHTGLSNSMDYY